MADVFLDPRVEDRFVHLDLNDIDQSIHISDAFMDSRTITLSNFKFPKYAFDLLQSISLPQRWDMKKFQFSTFNKALDTFGPRAPRYNILLAACRNDKGRLDALCELMDEVEQQIRTFVFSIFGSAPDRVEVLSRFSETRQENLHFDIDADSDTHEAFRMYINVDSAPRIWAMSHTLENLSLVARGRIDARRFKDLPSEQYVKHLTARCFGGWHNRADERQAPRHMVYFDPGDVWIVDGRSVSHQVLYGHRVITTYVRIPKRPGVRGTTEKVQNAIQAAIGPTNPAGDWIQPDREIEPADIKADWPTAFGKIGPGQLRRFNAKGLSS